MYRFIVMACGYVESAMTSNLIYQCEFFGNPGYSSCKEAITDLALDMYAKFYDARLSFYENRYKKNVKDCCRKSLIANKEAKFCSECGCQIKDKEFDYDEFMEYIRRLHSTTCDSYGDTEFAANRKLTWYPYCIGDFIGEPKEDVIFISENAEVILLAALLEAKPELKLEDYELPFGADDWENFKNEIQSSYQ